MQLWIRDWFQKYQKILQTPNFWMIVYMYHTGLVKSIFAIFWQHHRSTMLKVFREINLLQLAAYLTLFLYKLGLVKVFKVEKIKTHLFQNKKSLNPWHALMTHYDTWWASFQVWGSNMKLNFHMCEVERDVNAFIQAIETAWKRKEMAQS